VSALASRDDRRLTILLWNYHDDDVAGPAADVSLAISGLPATASALHMRRYLVDAGHGNAFAEWRQMGAPASLDAIQASEPRARQPARGGGGSRDHRDAAPVSLHLPLERQAVSLLVIEW
jgi:xylan 1,4-beta-xylosidase